MQFNESDLKSLIGSKSYRSKAIREALSEGRSAYGPVTLLVDHQSSMMEVQGPFFSTMFDLRELKQTEDGVSVTDLREKIDELITEQTEEHIVEAYW